MEEVTLAQLGESVTEGLVARWLKQVGDTVDEFEPIVEIVTDKVNVDIAAECRGILRQIVVQEGESVQVGTVLARIERVNA